MGFLVNFFGIPGVTEAVDGLLGVRLGAFRLDRFSLMGFTEMKSLTLGTRGVRRGFGNF